MSFWVSGSDNATHESRSLVLFGILCPDDVEAEFLVGILQRDVTCVPFHGH